MPVTKGSGNPIWTRDETLLAYDLYFKHGGPVYRDHPDVIELSEFLRSLDLHGNLQKKANFRNVDGVALKLQNLHAAVTRNESGLSSSKADKKAVLDFPFPGAKSEIAALGLTIRESIASSANQALVLPTEDSDTFFEGKIVTATHKRRERDPKLRNKLLSIKRGPQGQLRCEMCDFEAGHIEAGLSDCMFEAHHIKPLSSREIASPTKVTDLSLLCASCHRLIHRLISKRQTWVPIEEARELRLNGQK